MSAKRAEPAGAKKPRTIQVQEQVVEPKTKVLELPEAISVSSLAEAMEISAVEVIKQLMRNGIMANINQVISYDIASKVASSFGYKVQEVRRAAHGAPAKAAAPPAEAHKGELRPPVVTILGHVDHGKTTLLDAIRKSNVAATEAGSITQHIGAYQVEVDGRKITFLDTPGHEAFTAMRARGARITDIAILVVAADDGVMPQTVEAINHARAAGVPILVAINKVDKPNANVDRVKKQLADLDLLIEEWGGDVISVPVAAKARQGITELLENLLVLAEILDLRADPNRPAQGAVIEAKLDKYRGPVATLLVQDGTLRLSDVMVVGNTWGRIKAMFNDQGKHIKKAGPATPVEILGLNEVPHAGDTFTVAASERQARELLQKQKEEQESLTGARRAATLDSLAAQIIAGQAKELNVIIKTDVQGSVEPIRDSLDHLQTDQAKVRVIHAGSGSITESDVLLALASKGIIVGFNTRPEPGAKRLADMEGVDIRIYDVIYSLIEDVEKALRGLHEPKFADVVEGRAQVLAVFPVRKLGKVAGSRVLEGTMSRGCEARLIRNGQVVKESTVSSLRHYQDNVQQVGPGQECGIGFEGFSDFEVGDIIECHRKQQVS